MDWKFIYECIPLYAEAAQITVQVAVLGIAGAIVIGLICSLIKELQIPILRHLVQGYIELSRNTPLLIQLFFCILVCRKSEFFSAPGRVQSSDWCFWEEAIWQRPSAPELTIFPPDRENRHIVWD